MPEKIENYYNFSKTEDLEKFNELPKEEQDAYVEISQEKANKENEKFDDFVIEMATNCLMYSSQDLSEKKFSMVIQKSLSLALSWGAEGFNNAVQIKDKFQLPSDIFNQAVKEGLIYFLSNKINRDIDYIEKIKGEFPIPDKIFHQAIVKGLSYCVSEGELNFALNLKEKYSILDEEFEKCINDGFSFALLNGDQEVNYDEYDHNEEFLDSAILIKNTFSLTDEQVNAIFPGYFPYGFNYQDMIEMREIPNIGKDLSKSIVNLKNFSYIKNIQPLINAQGEAAFLYFDSIKQIENFKNLTEKDIEYITLVGKKYGTRARNILENLLPRVGVGKIGQEKNIIEEYLSEINIICFDTYSQYKEFVNSSQREKILELKERILGLQDSIYKGDVEKNNFEDPLYPTISYHVFQPAIGLTQDQYSELNEKRPDRRNDVPMVLNTIQYKKFEVSNGKYALSDGEELNLEKWKALGKAVKKVNAEFEKHGQVKIDEEEIACKLIEMYKGKNSEKTENQDYLFENMYRFHLLRNGGKLENNFTVSIEGLMKYKEFVGDHVKNDLIKDCLIIWKKNHENEFAELKADTLNRLKSSQAQNFSKVSNMFNAIKKQKDEIKKEKAIINLDEFLKNFNLSYEIIRNKNIDEIKTELDAIVVEYEGDLNEENYRSDKYYNSEAFLKAFDNIVCKYDNDQLIYQKISSDLVAGINKKMRKEVKKFKFENETGELIKRELEFIVSKKKEHGVVGYNMGVCVTPDEKLWNDPQFINCIILDPKLKQAMGGMHFLIRENNLCLPGINPSLDILGQVKTEELFDKMIEYAKNVKEKLGLDKVLIPIDSCISSNRTQIQEIITNKAYNKHNLRQEANFSYSPYKYSFQECFEIE